MQISTSADLQNFSQHSEAHQLDVRFMSEWSILRFVEPDQGKESLFVILWGKRVRALKQNPVGLRYWSSVSGPDRWVVLVLVFIISSFLISLQIKHEKWDLRWKWGWGAERRRDEGAALSSLSFWLQHKATGTDVSATWAVASFLVDDDSTWPHLFNQLVVLWGFRELCP